MNRDAVIEQLKKNNQVSVMIVGAGINGAGTFRDLALNGVDVLLIDRGDFCSGASSASSHMAHGGIRYLENGEFRLVREAVRERNRMIENAPHIVRPLPTTIPIFKFWSGLLNAPLKFLNLLDRPAERGAFIIKAGLIMYDAYTRSQKTVPTHRMRGRTASLEMFPRLNPDILFTATYYDGQILSPERYTVELVKDGEAEGPHARAVNYLAFLRMENGTAVLRDELSGQEFTVKPGMIINAAGPWIDPVNRQMGIKKRYIGGTKGSHLVLDNPELRRAIGDHEFFFENKDGRIVLIFPFYDRLIVGTSDLPIEDADTARCTPEEEQYFIDLVARVFPDIPVTKDQIIFRFSGVRPLEFSHAKSTGQISRDHSIQEDRIDDVRVLSLVGGKWTSYRAFSEQVTDRVLGYLGKARSAGTEDLPVGGGRDYPKSVEQRNEWIRRVSAEGNLAFEQAQRLFDRYGTGALQVARSIAGGKDAPLQSLPAYTRREIQYLTVEEKAARVDDLLLRRSTIAWLGHASRPLVEELAEVMGETLGWDSKRRQAEVERTLTILKDLHGLTL